MIQLKFLTWQDVPHANCHTTVASIISILLSNIMSITSIHRQNVKTKASWHCAVQETWPGIVYHASLGCFLSIFWLKSVSIKLAPENCGANWSRGIKGQIRVGEMKGKKQKGCENEFWGGMEDSSSKLPSSPVFQVCDCLLLKLKLKNPSFPASGFKLGACLLTASLLSYLPLPVYTEQQKMDAGSRYLPPDYRYESPWR